MGIGALRNHHTTPGYYRPTPPATFLFRHYLIVPGSSLPTHIWSPLLSSLPEVRAFPYGSRACSPSLRCGRYNDGPYASHWEVPALSRHSSFFSRQPLSRLALHRADSSLQLFVEDKSNLLHNIMARLLLLTTTLPGDLSRSFLPSFLPPCDALPLPGILPPKHSRPNEKSAQVTATGPLIWSEAISFFCRTATLATVLCNLARRSFAGSFSFLLVLSRTASREPTGASCDTVPYCDQNLTIILSHGDHSTPIPSHNQKEPWAVLTTFLPSACQILASRLVGVRAYSLSTSLGGPTNRRTTITSESPVLLCPMRSFPGVCI